VYTKDEITNEHTLQSHLPVDVLLQADLESSDQSLPAGKRKLLSKGNHKKTSMLIKYQDTSLLNTSGTAAQTSLSKDKDTSQVNLSQAGGGDRAKLLRLLRTKRPVQNLPSLHMPTLTQKAALSLNNSSVNVPGARSKEDIGSP
jgi:hypothetical protein